MFQDEEVVVAVVVVVSMAQPWSATRILVMIAPLPTSFSSLPTTPLPIIVSPGATHVPSHAFCCSRLLCTRTSVSPFLFLTLHADLGCREGLSFQYRFVMVVCVANYGRQETLVHARGIAFLSITYVD